MIRYIFLALSLLTSSQLFSTLIHEIDTCKALNCSFSIKQHNRIIVDGGLVKKLICPEGVFNFRLDADSGQAFVLVENISNEPTLISVITDEGRVQDLSVTLENKPSEVIVLKSSNSEEQAPSVLEEDVDHEMVSILLSLMDGTIPEGYSPREVSSSDDRSQRSFRLKAKICVEGPYEKIYAYELVNLLNVDLHISEESISNTSDLWIYLESNKIPPRKSSRVIISRRKN